MSKTVKIETREMYILCARVYLSEAARRRHIRSQTNFYFTLLQWAANRRKAAMALSKAQRIQGELF